MLYLAGVGVQQRATAQEQLHDALMTYAAAAAAQAAATSVTRAAAAAAYIFHMCESCCFICSLEVVRCIRPAPAQNNIGYCIMSWLVTTCGVVQYDIVTCYNMSNCVEL